MGIGSGRSASRGRGSGRGGRARVQLVVDPARGLSAAQQVLAYGSVTGTSNLSTMNLSSTGDLLVETKPPSAGNAATTDATTSSLAVGPQARQAIGTAPTLTNLKCDSAGQLSITGDFVQAQNSPTPSLVHVNLQSSQVGIKGLGDQGNVQSVKVNSNNSLRVEQDGTMQTESVIQGVRRAPNLSAPRLCASGRQTLRLLLCRWGLRLRL